MSAVHRNPDGTGTAVFTTNGATARKYPHKVAVGQVGVDVPCSTADVSWIKRILHMNFYGERGIEFDTQIKTVISQRKAEDATLTSPAVTMPTMGCEILYITCHLADAFIQSNLE